MPYTTQKLRTSWPNKNQNIEKKKKKKKSNSFAENILKNPSFYYQDIIHIKLSRYWIAFNQINRVPKQLDLFL